jgi:protein-tyrosine phosphatase
MVVPYMSIDLFFVAAPFLCRDESELRTFARRIAFSILLAGVFFLALPLQTAFPRTPVDGWLGLVFDTFRSMDAPHNLFPSLHITLCVLLANLYARRTSGLIRLALLMWFSLIGLSPMLTHQHQLVDIAGGLLLAGLACHLFRESDVCLPVVPNFRVGSYYGAAAVTVLAFVPAAWPWSAFLLWPATALAIAAGAYFGLGPGLFRKNGGRLPLGTRIVLAPVLLGHYLSLVYYRRQCRAWDELAPGVLIGRILSNSDAAAAVEHGVTAVLDLTAEFSESAAFRGTNYRNLPILDLTAPTQDQLHEAAMFVAEESAKGTVYVHCKIGYSRSAAVAGAYLLASRQAVTVDDVVVRLRAVRPSIVIRAEAIDALCTFAETSEAESRNESEQLIAC